MNKHFLMKLPLYLMGISIIYTTIKRYRNQTEWNTIKKWNLAGIVFSILGLFFYVYQDFFLD